MTERDPFAVGSRFERLRNIGESCLQRAGEFGGRLVAELADRAMLIGCVLLVAEDLGGGGTAHRRRQDDNPCAPATATPCESRVHTSALEHPFDASRDRPRAARAAPDSACVPGRSRIQDGAVGYVAWDGVSERSGTHLLRKSLTPDLPGRTRRLLYLPSVRSSVDGSS